MLDCDKVNCPPEPTSFSSKNGVSKSIEDAFENIIDKATDQIENFIKKADSENNIQ